MAALAAVLERTADDPFLPGLRKRAEALAAGCAETPEV